jgi:multidrug efflux system outer membrane protein
MDPPANWRAPSPQEDSLRAFYDSLAAHRDTAGIGARDSTMPAGDSSLVPRPQPTLSDSAADLGWFALLQDTVLQRLVQTAVQQNRNVRTAIASIDEFRAQYGIQRAALFPLVTGNASGGTNRVVFAGGAPIAYDVWSATANVSWELDFWGKLRRGTEAARSDLMATEESRRAVVLSLVSDVAQAYLELRELDLDLAVSHRTLDSRRETLRLAQRRFQQGLISELDVRQFEAQVADPAVRVADFERQIAVKEDQLSILLGRQPAAVPRGAALSSVLAPIAIPNELPATLLDRRPDVRQAEAQFHAATARIGVAKAELLPRVMITGEWGSQAAKPGNVFTSNTEIYQLLGGISIPIFAGGALTSEVKIARARAEQARYQYEQTFLAALQEAQDAFVSLRTSRDQLVAQQLQVTALRSALALATRRYENGISSYLDVLDAQRSLFTAELALAQVQRQELVSAVQLYKALGGGWSADASAVPR